MSVCLLWAMKRVEMLWLYNILLYANTLIISYYKLFLIVTCKDVYFYLSSDCILSMIIDILCKLSIKILSASLLGCNSKDYNYIRTY